MAAMNMLDAIATIRRRHSGSTCDTVPGDSHGPHSAEAARVQRGSEALVEALLDLGSRAWGFGWSGPRSTYRSWHDGWKRRSRSSASASSSPGANLARPPTSPCRRGASPISFTSRWTMGPGKRAVIFHGRRSRSSPPGVMSRILFSPARSGQRVTVPRSTRSRGHQRVRGRPGGRTRGSGRPTSRASSERCGTLRRCARSDGPSITCATNRWVSSCEMEGKSTTHLVGFQPGGPSRCSGLGNGRRPGAGCDPTPR